MAKDPKDIYIEGKPRIIKDKVVKFGQHKGKLFSEVLANKADFEYCLELSENMKNMREFVNYIIESDEMLDYEEKMDKEEEEKLLKNPPVEKGEKKK